MPPLVAKAVNITLKCSDKIVQLQRKMDFMAELKMDSKLEKSAIKASNVRKIYAGTRK